MKLNYAVLSGCCASAASLFGKLVGLPILRDLLLIRVLCFCLMILSNAAVWTLFVKALHGTESSLIPTVLSAASNYLLSTIAGFFIFGEITTLLGWAGISFIIIGLLLILRDQSNHTIEEKKKD